MTLKDQANAIRILAMDAVEKAQSGHPGMPMGLADVATVLFSKFLKFNPQDPQWPDRDRFVLSAGHGSMLLYSLLYLTGYKKMTLEELKNFRQLGARTAGHPEYGLCPGIETTTGPLGQGLGNAVGMALAERGMRARFGKDIANHKTYVIVGDGCLMEGISQEVISFAGHQKLNNLIVLFDDNAITIDGPTSLSTSENHLKRFEACGWATKAIDGHDYEQIEKALSEAQSADRPVLIACKTIIGYGSPKKAGTSDAHGAPLGTEEIAETRKQLGWAEERSFEIPDDILRAWRQVGCRSAHVHKEWQTRFNKLSADQKRLFDSMHQGDISETLGAGLKDFYQKIAAEKPKIATRKSSEKVIEQLLQHIPNLWGGSADLTGSNNTKVPSMGSVTPENPGGQYIYYGIREHGMVAIMNGIALHGGFIPFGGTFLAFTDYCRPAIRLSALMKQRVIYVMTHDSIGLGEDGPTHQPIEHLWSLRLIPNLNVFRPADTIETAECWELALGSRETPSILALTRQNLPTVREVSSENLCSKGGYVLQENKAAVVTLIATGSEVSLALDTMALLKEKGVVARVVSMPCTRLFDQQPKAYQQAVLGQGLRVALEAGHPLGWRTYVGEQGLTLGIETFGESAPIHKLYDHFGLTAEKISKKIIHHLEKGQA
ncbi:MAG: transketolase [Alphaproteobacteria bacterium]